MSSVTDLQPHTSNTEVKWPCSVYVKVYVSTLFMQDILKGVI